METIIDQIIAIEWRMFHSVNEGQEKAGCQEDPATFSLMRRSQFDAWSEDACRSYLQDLTAAEASGRNLPEEKYIHMMARCTPEAYGPLAGRLPAVTAAHRLLAQAVNTRLMDQAAALRKTWPFLDRIGRPLYAAGDSPADTSIETYQLGELLTYSQRTLGLLLSHIESQAAQGISLAETIQLNCLRRMGFRSFADASALVMGRDQ